MVAVLISQHIGKVDFLRRFRCKKSEFCTCNLLTQIIFALQQYLPYGIWSFLWLHMEWPVLWGTTFQLSPASCLEHSPDFPRACTPRKSLPSICLTYMRPLGVQLSEQLLYQMGIMSWLQKGLHLFRFLWLLGGAECFEIQINLCGRERLAAQRGCLIKFRAPRVFL